MDIQAIRITQAAKETLGESFLFCWCDQCDLLMKFEEGVTDDAKEFVLCKECQAIVAKAAPPAAGDTEG